jgi:hypothetical protein
MSLIRPRTRGKQFVQLRTRLEDQNHETLHAYAAFLGEDAEYVLNELIDGLLAKDKEFVTWRTSHSHTYAPQALAARVPVHTTGRGKRAASAPDETGHLASGGRG